MSRSDEPESPASVGRTLLVYGVPRRSANLLYLTRFPTDEAVVYVEHGSRRLLLVTPLDVERARVASRATDVVRIDQFAPPFVGSMTPAGWLAAAIAGALGEIHADSVEIPSDFPVQLADLLRGRGLQLFINGGGIAARRRRKDAQELQAIESVLRRTEASLERLFDRLRHTERASDGSLRTDGHVLTAENLRAHLERDLFARGCLADDTIVASGPASADPHAIGAGPIRAGEPIVIDVFPKDRSNGYFADVTRTVWVDPPQPLLLTMHAAVREALDAAIHTVRPGITGRDVHEVVEDALFDRGFATRRKGHERAGLPAFVHAAGHGVGLDLHEEPQLGRNGRASFEVGNVIALEPGLYDEHIGGVRIEDLVVVTEDGCRVLTRAPKEPTL